MVVAKEENTVYELDIIRDVIFCFQSAYETRRIRFHHIHLKESGIVSLSRTDRRENVWWMAVTQILATIELHLTQENSIIDCEHDNEIDCTNPPLLLKGLWNEQ